MHNLLTHRLRYGLILVAIATTELMINTATAIATTQHLAIDAGTQVAYSTEPAIALKSRHSIPSKPAMNPNSSPLKGYIWPTKGVLTSGFGQRWGRNHNGIDISAPVGTPVIAAASGIVVSASWHDGGYGNLVKIQHPDGSLTFYAHNNRMLVQPGQSVEQGQPIAQMGSTGYSSGPHCHFEIRFPRQGAVNPLAYLPQTIQ